MESGYMRLKERFFTAVVTAGYLGYMPAASGTFGTLPAVAAFVAIMLWAPAQLQTWLILAALVVSCFATVALSPWAEKHWGKKDPGAMVMDEVAGFLLTVLLFRRGDLLLLTVWAFVATRAFDIVKIPPARQCERLGGGWGILLDDLVASVQAAAFLHVVAVVFPRAMGIG